MITARGVRRCPDEAEDFACGLIAYTTRMNMDGDVTDVLLIGGMSPIRRAVHGALADVPDIRAMSTKGWIIFSPSIFDLC